MQINEENLCNIINQFFEIKRKVLNQDVEKSLSRNLKRITNELENMGYVIHDPIGEKYDLSRLDCEAMATGPNGNKELAIVEVIKPIIYQKRNDRNIIIQKAVIIVE